jgi:hypothetical protein
MKMVVGNATFTSMAVYLCRWPNGEFSIVSAASRELAIEMLDEWGNAEQASLSRMADCMLDFRLTDDGQMEFASVGETTYDHIVKTCYPELGKALAKASWEPDGLSLSARSQRRIREAVQMERTRLWDSQPAPKDAETTVGREIQKRTGAASVLVNRIVREAAKKRLESKEGEGKKPN